MLTEFHESINGSINRSITQLDIIILILILIIAYYIWKNNAPGKIIIY
jgi:hypothetical protein